ncbi:MAG TPA: CHASE domain-containing protein [Verrucomicrobiae bacterium]|jgi:PAS domain S-box-containing protein
MACTYYLAARLALLLAIPPGYATAVWPAAGLALGGTLLFGYRVWPGILLGSFLANVWTSLDTTSAVSILKSVALAASIGAGASLQAMAGAWLVRRFVGWSTTLVLEEKVLKFLALGGPVSCMVNATVAVTSLWTAGAIQWSSYPFHWFTWWVGDTIGALIFAPLVLIWLAPTRPIGLRRQLSVSLPLALAFGMVVAVFVYTSALEQRRLKLEFDRSTDNLAQTLGRTFDGYLDALGSVESLLASSPEIDRRGFARFAEQLAARHPGIHAVSWHPRVTDAERSAVEAAGRRDGPKNFQFTERDAERKLIRAADRAEYFPAYFVEPLKRNRAALGFDSGSISSRLQSMNRARDTGQPAATGRITITQDPGRQAGVMVFTPLYQPGSLPATVAERRQDIRGFAAALYRIGDMMETVSTEARREGIEIRLFDEAAPESQRLAYDSSARAPSATNSTAASEPRKSPLALARTVSYAMAGRPWVLEFTPAPEYFARYRSWLAWGVQAGGLLCTGLLGALLLVVTGRTVRTEVLVTERTAELRQANQDLRHQVAERERAEGELRKTQDGLERRVLERTDELARTNTALQTEIHTHEQTEQALRVKQRELVEFIENAAVGMRRVLADGTILWANQFELEMLGYARAEYVGHHIEEFFQDPRTAQEIFLRLNRGEALHDFETQLRCKDGSIKHVLINSNVLWKGGQCLDARFFTRDITERKRAEAQITASLKEKEALLKEIHHRVKNNLQVISSLLRMQAGAMQDPHARELFQESQDRVKTMALIHERLCQSQNLAGIEFDHHLRDLASMVFRSYSTRSGAITLNVQAESAFLAIETAVPVSIMVNEMVSNCLKHAFPDGRSGAVSIQFRRDDQQRFHLVVRDNGVGLPGDFASLSTSSLGLSLVNILTEQLGGELACRTGNGTEFELTFRGQTHIGRS